MTETIVSSVGLQRVRGLGLTTKTRGILKKIIAAMLMGCLFLATGLLTGWFSSREIALFDRALPEAQAEAVSRALVAWGLEFKQSGDGKFLIAAPVRDQALGRLLGTGLIRAENNEEAQHWLLGSAAANQDPVTVRKNLIAKAIRLMEEDPSVRRVRLLKDENGPPYGVAIALKSNLVFRRDSGVFAARILTAIWPEQAGKPLLVRDLSNDECLEIQTGGAGK